MNIQDWGALGELVGAVAVVATLVFLTTQIRQNTRTMRASAVQVAMGKSADLMTLLLKDQELHDLFWRFYRGEQLGAEQWQRLSMFHTMNLRNVQSALYQLEQGLFDEETFELWNRGLADFCLNPQYREFVDSSPLVPDNGRAYVRSLYPNDEADQQMIAHRV